MTAFQAGLLLATLMILGVIVLMLRQQALGMVMAVVLSLLTVAIAAVMGLT